MTSINFATNQEPQPTTVPVTPDGPPWLLFGLGGAVVFPLVLYLLLCNSISWGDRTIYRRPFQRRP